MRVHVINLERSAERWRDIETSAHEAGLEVSRVPAVDGADIPRESWVDVDHGRFARSHGRYILPGEYGCYRSHLAALDAIIAADQDIGTICEDDILFSDGFQARIEAILADRPGLHVLKLANHRAKGFIPHGSQACADDYGRCLHGPQGSAACYVVTGEGARRLRSRLATMWLPFDIALERGWAMGLEIYTTRENAIGFNPGRGRSTITTSKTLNYKSSKLPLIARAPVAAFRGAEYVRRALYAVKK